MLHSHRTLPVPPYLGVDLTDGHSASRRPVDVCGLLPEGGGLRATFWTWSWVDGGLDSVLRELRAARCTLIDGPQGLARQGFSLREGERLTATAGKTPSTLSAIRGPYAGFVHSSVELFLALSEAGLPISVPGFIGGVGEVYPGHAWKALAPRLDKKTTPSGVGQRVTVLGVLGVRVPPSPTHDQLDAALAAAIAAAADGRVPGLQVKAIGLPLTRRLGGELEEGPLAVPFPDEDLIRRIEDALGERGVTAAARPKARPRQEERGASFPCPIPGCAHVFHVTRGGWDAHVASLRSHPGWMPHVSTPEARKAAFRREFLGFFA